MTTDAKAEDRMNRVHYELGVSLDFVSIRRHTFRSLVLRFKNHPEGVGMMLAACRDRDLDVVYCESSLCYRSGAIESYSGMPDVLFSLEETLREIYRFYFLYYCLSKIGRKSSHTFAIPRKKKQLSLQTLSMTWLSTSELYNVRQHLCMAWA